MIVLFGPTSSEKFAPKSNYTKILDSKIIHNTSDIDSITVMKFIINLNFKILFFLILLTLLFLHELLTLIKM